MTNTKAYNRKRNNIEMKNLAIAASIAVDYMEPNKSFTAKSANNIIGGVTKSQFAWAFKKGEKRGFFTRVYNKKARCFEYYLNDEKF